MADIEWVKKELKKYRQEEIEAVANLKKFHETLLKARDDFAQAKETLAGIRGGIREFEYQLGYAKEHGKLP